MLKMGCAWVLCFDAHYYCTIFLNKIELFCVQTRQFGIEIRWSRNGACCDCAKIEIVKFSKSLLNNEAVNQVTMGNLQVICGIKKFDNQNYPTWQMCIESYLQEQDS